jgi:hypothetical protein
LKKTRHLGFGLFILYSYIVHGADVTTHLSSGFVRQGDASKGGGGASQETHGWMGHQTELKKRKSSCDVVCLCLLLFEKQSHSNFQWYNVLKRAKTEYVLQIPLTS